VAELHQLSLLQLSDMVRRKEASPGEIVSCFLERAALRQDDLHAFLCLRDEALEEAEAAGGARGGPGPSLTGLPLAVKDNICTPGVPTTCASRILEDYRPPYAATAWDRLRRGGALLMGKTNMDEFAMGSSTEFSAFGPTRNPYDPTLVPGGSSGGSAAAVAAGLVPAALGTDTGGSVRQPAALCGVVGLKPTWGRVSRYGLVSYASSLDQIGPIARTATDCALIMDLMAGPDPMDSTTAAGPGGDRFLEAARRPPGRFRFGVADDLETGGVEPDVRRAVEEGLRVLEEMGGSRVDISLPLTRYAIAAYYVLAPAEASSNLARFDGVRYGLRRQGKSLLDTCRKTRGEGFGAEVKRRIMLGTYALSAGYRDAFYHRAGLVRSRVLGDYERAFEEVSIVVGPTSPTTAFPLGERTRDPLAMYLSDAFTVPASLAGLPAVSLPCGTDSAGLPVGLQLTGPPFAEGPLLSVAHQFLQARPPGAPPGAA
jgi:aspartyl-tRNA(Asn)/glutamyl-tRNA(Gln) amidotransferase subunit A